MIVALAALLGLVIGVWIGLRTGVKICNELAKARGVDLTADSPGVEEMKRRVGYESEL